MKYYLKATIPLLIGVFILPASALAATILYESLEYSGDLVIPQATAGTPYLVGSFTPENYHLLDPDDMTHFGLMIKTDTPSTCNSTQGFIASSTASTINPADALWNSDAIPVTGSYVFNDVERNPGLSSAQYLIPGHTYGIYVTDCFTGTFSLAADSFGLVYYGYFSWDGDNDSFLGGRTRIISVFPANGSVIPTASSTSIEMGASWNIDEGDITGFPTYKNQKLLICYQKQPIGEEHCIVGGDSNYYPGAGANATTTFQSLEEGNYIVNATLYPTYLGGVFKNPFSDGLGTLQSGSLTSKYSQFTVGDGTLGGNIFQGLVGNIQTNLDNATSTGFSGSLSRCNPLNFDAMLCFSSLFTFDSQDGQSLLTFANENILKRVPVGYLTRMVAIFDTPATSTLPIFSITMKEGTPFEGDFTLRPGDTLAQADTILRDDWTSDGGLIETEDDLNIWDTFMTWITIFGYLGLFFLIIRDITGLDLHRHKEIKTPIK